MSVGTCLFDATLNIPQQTCPLRRGYELALEGVGAGGDKHEERLRGLWARQLAVPLGGGEEVMAEYAAWEQGKGKVSMARFGQSFFTPDHNAKAAFLCLKIGSCDLIFV